MADTTLDRLIRILGAFDAGHGTLTVAALARRAELPLPTAYRWVDRLAGAGLLRREADGTVRPGLRLWELASRGAPTVPLARAAMPFLLDVQAVLRQHTQLAVLDDDGVLVLERLSAQDAVANQATVAGRLPTFTTSLGLVLLAHAPVAQAEHFHRRHGHELGGPVRPPGPAGGDGLRTGGDLLIPARRRRDAMDDVKRRQSREHTFRARYEARFRTERRAGLRHRRPPRWPSAAPPPSSGRPPRTCCAASDRPRRHACRADARGCDPPPRRHGACRG